MNDLKSFRLMIGLLAAAWIVVGLAIGAALFQAGMAGEPLGIATLLGIAVGAAGLLGTWSLRKWGPPLYLAANLIMIVKPWLFGTAPAEPLGWGYWLLLALFVGLVAANWNRFRD